MKIRKYLGFILLGAVFGVTALAQELPPAAIWVGLPIGSFKVESFREIGVAVAIDCDGQHLSQYGQDYPEYDQKCFQWKRSVYNISGEQSYEDSFCFVAHHRDEKLIKSDTQSLVILVANTEDGKSKVWGVTDFPNTYSVVEQSVFDSFRKRSGSDSTAKMHKFQPINPIDCETRKSLYKNPWH